MLRPIAGSQTVVSTIYRRIPISTGDFTTAFSVDELTSGIGLEGNVARSITFRSFRIIIQPSSFDASTGNNWSSPVAQPFLFYNNLNAPQAVPVTPGRLLNLTQTTTIRVNVPVQFQSFAVVQFNVPMLSLTFTNPAGAGTSAPPMTIQVVSVGWLTISPVSVV